MNHTRISIGLFADENFIGKMIAQSAVLDQLILRYTHKDCFLDNLAPLRIRIDHDNLALIVAPVDEEAGIPAVPIVQHKGDQLTAARDHAMMRAGRVMWGACGPEVECSGYANASFLKHNHNNGYKFIYRDFD
jgi:hypothetical protein